MALAQLIQQNVVCDFINFGRLIKIIIMSYYAYHPSANYIINIRKPLLTTLVKVYSKYVDI